VLTVAAAVVLGAVVAAGVYTLYERQTKNRLGHQVRAYEVISDTVVRVTFEVSLADGERGECKVRARGRDGLEKGAAVVPVGPGSGGALITTYELATTSRASTGEVVGCRAIDRP
jgi:hypothetical protein